MYANQDQYNTEYQYAEIIEVDIPVGSDNVALLQDLSIRKACQRMLIGELQAIQRNQ